MNLSEDSFVIFLLDVWGGLMNNVADEQSL